MISGDNFATAPRGYSFTFINVIGRAMAVPVPSIALKAGNVVGTTATCDCSDGSCTLTETAVGPYTAYTCSSDGCPGGCTLEVTESTANGVITQIAHSKGYQH